MTPDTGHNSGMWNPFARRRVYLDYASATPVFWDALDASIRAVRTFANPGAIHADGGEAKHMLADARARIARELAVKPREIVCTSGGTEGDNLAILGTARALMRLRETLIGTHWIVSAIEHPAVLECFGEIERLGGSVSFIDPDSSGIIQVDSLARLLRPETVFVSIGWANHEIGTIQPIRQLVRTVRAYEEVHGTHVTVHADAGQAPLSIPPHVHTIDADLVTFDSGKLYGPRGVGVVYVSNRSELAPILMGGKQERGLRPGTENVALVVGFARALERVGAERAHESVRVRALRDALAREILGRITDAVVNGAPAARRGEFAHVMPHMLNISIPAISSEYVVLALDQAGISISTKSACREGEESRSHVVAALGGEEWRAQNTLRFSLGQSTRARDIPRVARVLAEAVLR